jgi:hypothetical protein
MLGQEVEGESHLLSIQEVRRVLEEVMREGKGGMKESGYSSLEFSITRRDGNSFRQAEREKSDSPLIRDLNNILTPTEKNSNKSRNMHHAVENCFIVQEESDNKQEQKKSMEKMGLSKSLWILMRFSEFTPKYTKDIT